jgi:hypothetical protein
MSVNSPSRSWSMMLALLAILLMAKTVHAQIVPASTALTIDSDSSCPSANAVQTALVDLRPTNEWPAIQVAIRTHEQTLVVEIGSREIKRRQLIVGQDCGARATTVALIIATWMNDLPAETADSPILRSSPIVSQPKAPADRSLVRQSEVKAERSYHEINLGGMVAWGGGLVPGLHLDYARFRRPSGFGIQVSITVPGSHDVDLGIGITHWTRISAGMALVARWTARNFYLAADAGAVAALTYAWGEGYTVNQTDRSFNGSLVAGLRAGVPFGRFQIWTDIRAFRWLYNQNVEAEGDSNSRVRNIMLPSWDGQWALGIGYVFH